ncbi:MAG TPA: hypothetical protein VFI23_11235 [Rhizomicrobium sp.]|nr:hypothetical protein [Rhizomicrobium sp.]
MNRTFNVAAGFVDYARGPGRWAKLTPFNGQACRRQIFEALRQLNFAAIIETGTHVGTTAEYFAQTGLPVFSVEGNPRRYGFAKARLRRFKNLSLRLGDSRLQLHNILTGLGADNLQKPLFFYLDAHWKHGLPLAGELEIILALCAQPTIMIDDFQVADDPGYGFDDYGEGKVLARDYIEPFIVQNGLALFYPAASSADETGRKRGSVVLAMAGAKERVASFPQLRLVNP